MVMIWMFVQFWNSKEMIVVGTFFFWQMNLLHKYSVDIR